MADKTQTLSYSAAIGTGVAEEMRRDEKVVLWGEDVLTMGGAWRDMPGKFEEEFGTLRVQNMPIAEIAICEMAIGAALNGLRPVVQISTAGILLTAFDGVFCKMGSMRQEFGWSGPMPIVVYTRCGVGGGTGPDHSWATESLFMHSPGLKVVMPSTAYDAKGLMKAAIRDNDPVLFIGYGMRYRGSEEEIPEEEYIIPLGKADIKREGSDITIVTYAGMVARALTAAEEVNKQGINVEVIDLRTLVPLDIDTIIKSVRKTGRLIVAHEAMERGGAAAEISARVTEALPDFMQVMKAPIRRLAAKNVAIIRGMEEELAFQPQVPDIVRTIKDIA